MRMRMRAREERASEREACDVGYLAREAQSARQKESQSSRPRPRLQTEQTQSSQSPSPLFCCQLSDWPIWYVL